LHDDGGLTRPTKEVPMKFNRAFSLIAAIVVALASLTVPASAEAQQRRRASAQVGAMCVGGIDALFDAIELGELTDHEIAELSFLLEEEKMARDVYLELADRWQLPIFAKIAEAEQHHMDLVLKVFTIYGYDNPITDDTIGAFSNGLLAQYFSDFVAKGQLSLIDALEVGATIEDLDLADIYAMLADPAISNEHIHLVLYNLAKGSRNHLRAFVRALEAQGALYSPQYLDQETFESILEAEMETRMFYDSEGERVAACGGAVGGFGTRRGRGSQNGGQEDGQGDNGGNGNGNGNGNGECDGTGSDGNTNGGNGNGNGECDGSGSQGGGNNGGSGNGGGK
jgi:hypothetical protein